jgi:iron complex outermembrane receptor protein
MFRKKSLNRAVNSIIAASLSAGMAGSVSAAQLEEVIVTATKTEASTQDIPVAVSALTSESLEQLGVSNFEDYLVQLPGVTAGGGNGPGQSTVYIRGVASTTPNLTVAGVSGLVPNVALYLDEQPMAQPGRNLDVYIADIARVEVLAGPQGTLYGSSSQAGTVRLITNKPDLSAAYGKVKAGFATISDGGDSNNVEFMMNAPVSDNVAIRGVFYRDKKGGYVDGVAGTLSVADSARWQPAGTMRSNGVPVESFRGGFQAGADLSGVTFQEASAIVEEDQNEVEYTGGRISALIEFNDDWSLQAGVIEQQVESDGTFYSDPNLGDYEIRRYQDEFIEDEFSNFSLTLEGRIGALEVLYAGAYTDRDLEQKVDYSDYLYVGQYLPYYVCDYSVTYGDVTGNCGRPNLYVHATSTSELTTHELRVNTPADRSIRATVGAFFSDFEFTELNDFTYPDSVNAIGWAGVAGFGSNTVFPTPGYRTTDEPFPDDAIFRNDIMRTDEQLGLFGEVTFDVSDTISVTVGARYYDYEVDFMGSANASFYNFGGLGSTDYQAFGTDINDLYDGDGCLTWNNDTFNVHETHPTYCAGGEPPVVGVNGIDEDADVYRITNSLTAPDVSEDSGVIGKLTVSFTPDSDSLYYLTWSEGFRTGLLNRPGGAYQAANNYTVPFEVESDEVINIEFGWKLDMMDGAMRFNGSAYMIDIEKLQTTIFDTSIVNLFFSDNAADAEVKGIEGDLTYAASDNLTLHAAFSFLDTEVTDVLTPTGDVVQGSSLAYAPEFQGNLSARYVWDLDNGLTAHFMPSVAMSDSQKTDIIQPNSIELDSWTLVNVTAGVTNGTWIVEAFVDNLTDEMAAMSGSYVYDRERIAYTRPRTMGVRFTYDF